MAERAYFDWNAMAPLREEARAAMYAALALTGNASSVHAEGRSARRMIEQARDNIARLVGGESSNVTFTSNATEANGLALTPAIEIGGRREPRDRLFVVPSAAKSAICRQGGLHALEEHDVVRAGAARPAEGQGARHHLRVADRPLVGLPGPHRPAQHQRQPLDPEVLRDEPVLGLDVVAHVDPGEAGAVVGRVVVIVVAPTPSIARRRSTRPVFGRTFSRPSFTSSWPKSTM